MTGWRGIVYFLPLLIAQILPAAESLDVATRELARQIPAGLHSPASVTVRSLSDLAAADVAEVRRTLENELRGRGIAIVENAGVDEIRVTLSQNISGYLLVAEIKRGEERATILVPWAHSAGSVRADTGTVAVEKTLLLAQPDPILDLAKVDADLLILQPGRVARFGMESGRWVAKEAAPLTPLVLPRDARGRLVLQGGAYLAYLPGTICSGAVAPLDARCREAEEAWPLSREPSLRAFVARGKNSFDGRINAAGLGKSVPPFYAAAAVQEASGRLWLFTRLDGRAYLHDSSLEPVAPLGGWGSDIAGVNCGSESLVLATRPADSGEKDTVRVYQIVSRQAVERAPGVELPGPVTALWTADESSVLAVVRDLGSGEYAAYRLAITCGH